MSKKTSYISAKLTKIILSLSIGIGLIFGLFQIVLDVIHQKEQQSTSINMLIEALTPLASQAAYEMSEQSATEILSGAMAFPSILSVTILDDRGDVLAETLRQNGVTEVHPIYRYIYSDMDSFTVALKSRFLDQNVGILTLTIDRQLLGEEILFRAINILTFEVARNIILALASLFAFNWFIGTPLIRLSRNFAALSDTSGIPKPLRVPPNHADDEFGELIGNINRTLSERAEFESQLRRVQKMEAIGQLAGSIAHDFNNLLAIIKGNFDLLQKFYFDDQAALKHVDIANRAIDRGADLTRKLLSFARRGQTSVEDLSVNDIVRDVMQLLPRALTATYDIRQNLADDLWPVTVNRGDMQDSMINLALNAFDAMPRGGVLLFETSNRVLDEEYVRLHPQARTGDFVLLSVTDTGTGIPKDLQDRILEPFFTTKSKTGGTGLGLTMVYGFVQRSGGLMSINSEEDRGVTFNIYLPRATGASSGMMPISGVEELPPRIGDRTRRG